MSREHQDAGSVDEQLSIIDRLSALSFPDQAVRPGENGLWGGPGYHLAILRESQDFWDDRNAELVETAEAELEGNLAVLTLALAVRWGDPATIDLWPFLGLDDSSGSDLAPPDPLNFLCSVAASMQMWRLPGSERWVSLAIGQGRPRVAPPTVGRRQ